MAARSRAGQPLSASLCDRGLPRSSEAIKLGHSRAEAPLPQLAPAIACWRGDSTPDRQHWAHVIQRASQGVPELQNFARALYIARDSEYTVSRFPLPFSKRRTQACWTNSPVIVDEPHKCVAAPHVGGATMCHVPNLLSGSLLR